MKKTAWGKSARLLCVLLILTIVIIPQLGCQANLENNLSGSSAYQGISKEGYYLDTICQITVYAMKDEDGRLADMDQEEQEQEVLQIITDAFLECDKYEKILSRTIEDSEIARINQAQGEPVEVSDTTIEVLQKGIEYGRLSGGLFDITIGKASDLWDFHDVDEEHQAEGEIPDGEQLKEAVSHVDYTKIQIEGNTVTLEDPEMEIDLGGIAKGYISDKIAEFLESRGVTSAVINLGGNIVTVGGRTTALLSDQMTPFSIGITDPQSDRGELLGAFPCQNKVVVTSGTYERYMIKDGVKYHHILDVETGYPADTDVLSVTIIAEKGSGADADGISTTCLVLGMEKGMEWIESMDGVEAVFVDTEGNVQISDPSIQFEEY